MLSDEFSDHLKMTELLHGDILQHIANACVFDMKGLHLRLQRGCELAGGASELLQQKSSKACVWLADLDLLDQFFSMEKHVMSCL